MHMTTEQLTGVGLIVLAVLGAAWVAWSIVSRVRDGRADAAMRNAWETEIKGVTMPDYDGSTWDWPEGGLAEYFFAPAEQPTDEHQTRPWADAYDFEAETTDFIRSMKRMTDWYITERIQGPLALPAGH